MKQEFKWILKLRIEVDTDDGEELYNQSMEALESAQDAFFADLQRSVGNEDISDWEVLDEELK